VRVMEEEPGMCGQLRTATIDETEIGKEVRGDKWEGENLRK